MNLFIFDKITEDPVVAALLRFQETGDPDAYYTAARGLIDYAGQRLTGTACQTSRTCAIFSVRM